MKHMKISPVFLLAMVLLVTSFPALAGKQEYTKKKEISQNYKVSATDLLQVDNRFGNITVTHWNRNEVAIRVEIESKSNSESRAQENLDAVRIEIKKSGSTVSAVTNIREKTSWGNSNNERLTINYFISMPSKLTSDLSQKYGNINLPDRNDGKCSVHVKYGNLNAGDFTAELRLEAKYGNIDMGNLQTAYLDLGYVGSMICKDARSVFIDSKYSNLEMKNVQRMELDKKYGNLSVGSLDQAEMEVKYSEISVDRLKESLDVDGLDYSTLSIKEVSSTFNRINVEGRYGNLKLKISPKASFKVLAEDMKYGNYDIKGFNITDFSKEDNTFRSEINGGGTRRINFEGNNYSNLTIRAL